MGMCGYSGWNYINKNDHDQQTTAASKVWTHIRMSDKLIDGEVIKTNKAASH